ncbi:SMC-Scp complex subunit ScpB [Parvularcula marina]|uniref:SMC-Scp complex subunit ScpB n=1 Tax=Parvularcula marina TaxID=2292771 RepID=UPI003519AA11
MSKPEAKEDEPLDARGAQERLAAEYSPETDDTDTELADEPEEKEGQVVTLDGEEREEQENPFAREAADAEALRRLEAVLFASATPLTEAALEERVPGADLPRQLELLERHYDRRGVNLRKVNNAWQFVTAADVAHVLVEHRTQQRKLSRAALETLAIIAYHQPCSRAEIEEVRGVAVAKGSLDQLLELGWIRPRGRREVPGRPLIYGTTPAFLEHFGLEALSHLPGLSDLKAAGLLEARLPPGFEVPTPRADDAEEGEDPASLGEDAEFHAEFTEGDIDDGDD